MATSLNRILAAFTQERFREVTVVTLMVFSVIAQDDPIPVPQSSLKKTPGLTSLSLSALANHCRLLESLGLISRTKDKHDKRMFQLSLTPEGKTLWCQLN